MQFSLHPRPLLEHPHWQSLNGSWAFAFDDGGRWTQPHEVVFDRSIEVPYPPESEASGIHDLSFHPTLWYRTRITPEQPAGQLLYLHFGAVDYQATVWVNNQMVVQHQGGHTPFSAEISSLCSPGEEIEIVVRAVDDPHDLAQPRGKQTWQAEPQEIWYPRTSGIWQGVWLEPRPRTHLASLVWTANVERWEVALGAHLHGPLPAGLRLRLRLRVGDTLLADDEYAVLTAEITRTISLRDPGIGVARAELLWSPEHPQLIDVTLELIQDGQVIDRVRSYTALRSVAVDQQRFLLNGLPYPLKMVLDQGYWPQSLMSATDAQLRRDVELTRLLGFNGARKHQKIEDPRYLYWCDVLGLLVWEELPSTYTFCAQSVRRLTQEWSEAIERDRSHPCIVAWVPINESWGVPNLPLVSAQRDLVRALYHLTRALDPTRPVIGNDGWEYLITDIVAVHDYSPQPETLLARYGSREALENTLAHLRPHNHQLYLGEAPDQLRPVMLTEFGGVAFAPEGDPGWGYDRMADAQALQAQYLALLAAVHACTELSGFCYTQLTDTFQEKNGLLYADRTPKTDLAALAHATRGGRDSQDKEHDPDLGEMGYNKFWKRKGLSSKENL